MTPQEFKAWFDGFTEAINGVPTKAQWARVKERVGEIDGTVITEHHWHSNYWRYLIPQYREVWCSATSGNSASGVGQGSCNNQISNNYQSAIGNIQSGLQGQGFNSLTAMNSLGRAEAQSIAA